VVDLSFNDIEQIPPMVSAIKIDGKRLHELARAGIEVDRPPRPVTIHSFQLMPTDEPHVFLAAVECAPGTYVRTLAADLGTLLGGGAHLRNLRRTAVGRFTIGEAAGPDDCVLLPVEEAVRTLDRIDITSDLADLVANGRVLPTFDGPGPWALFDPAGVLVAERLVDGNEHACRRRSTYLTVDVTSRTCRVRR